MAPREAAPLLEQAAALGLPPEALAGMEAREESIEVPTDAVDALRLLTLTATQWRRAGERARPVGLDYAAVVASAAVAKIDFTPAVFADLRLLEAGAVAAFAEA